MHWDGQAPLNANTMLTRWLQDNIFRGLLAIIGIGNDVHDCYWIFRHYNQPCYPLKTCHGSAISFLLAALASLTLCCPAATVVAANWTFGTHFCPNSAIPY